MNKRYIILDSNDEYVNSVIWDGNLSTWRPPEGTRAVPVDQVDVTSIILKKYTAEEWLKKFGFSSLQLVTLLDLESKLQQANKTSLILKATRDWLNTVLLTFTNNPEPSNNWEQPPYTFEEASRDAVLKLYNN